MADDIKKHLKLVNSAETDADSGTGSLYDDDSSTGGTGTGGKTGVEFRFHDVLAAPVRDDFLPPEEMRRLVIVHRDLHKDRVQKQKFAREQREARKDGRFVPPDFNRMRALGMGGGGGGASQFKKHPISNMAQFSGMDKQVIGIPTLNEADTNAELKEQLENRLRNRYQNTPKFNPRPRPPG